VWDFSLCGMFSYVESAPLWSVSLCGMFFCEESAPMSRGLHPGGNIHSTWVHILEFNNAKKWVNILPVLEGEGFRWGGVGRFLRKKRWVGRVYVMG